MRAHSHVCDVRAKRVFECACDGRACGTFLGCAMCDRTFAHFRTFFVHFCDILRIFKVFSRFIHFFLMISISYSICQFKWRKGKTQIPSKLWQKIGYVPYNIRPYKGTTVQQYDRTTVQPYDCMTIRWYDGRPKLCYVVDSMYKSLSILSMYPTFIPIHVKKKAYLSIWAKVRVRVRFEFW